MSNYDHPGEYLAEVWIQPPELANNDYMPFNSVKLWFKTLVGARLWCGRMMNKIPYATGACAVSLRTEDEDKWVWGR
jgi:hypothetical protein